MPPLPIDFRHAAFFDAAVYLLPSRLILLRIGHRRCFHA